MSKAEYSADCLVDYSVANLAAQKVDCSAAHLVDYLVDYLAVYLVGSTGRCSVVQKVGWTEKWMAVTMAATMAALKETHSVAH